MDELPPRRAAAYGTARIARRTFRGVVLDDALHMRAAALVYFTVLSLVPFLAFVFAVLQVRSNAWPSARLPDRSPIT